VADGTDTASRSWKPDESIRYPEVFVWPPKPAGIARWLFGVPGFLLPWTALYIGLAATLWFAVTPSTGDMAHFSPGWVLIIVGRNLLLAIAWFGMLHYVLYVRQAQGMRAKYDRRWPAARSRRFTFGSQLRDNVFWTLCSGVPIWTAYEVVTMWMFANGHLKWLQWSSNPVRFVGMILLIPIFREVHFYAVHRLIHHPGLYRHVHSLHHRNTSPIPWSGLSMHPLEHVAYFSGVLIHWVVPSHPFHAMFHLMHAGISPALGHTGFDRIEIGSHEVPTSYYAHYLHHTLFEVNYADGVIPLDKWFGSFHDGTPEADERTKARRLARRSTIAVTAD